MNTQTPTLDQRIADVPDVDGRPFADVFAEHFAELTAFEREYGTYAPAQPVTPDWVRSLAGLDGFDFGRDRGVSIDVDEDAWDDSTTPYLIVHTRNGGGNREHWGDDHDDRTEPGCPACIMRVVDTYPGYHHDRDNSFDCTYADIFFTLPQLPADGTCPTDVPTRMRLDRLASDRRMVAEGKIVPWFFLPEVEGRRPQPTYPYGFTTGKSEVDKAREALTERRAALEAEVAAYEAAPAPSKRPDVRRERNRGVNGRPLKSTSPIRHGSLAAEFDAYTKALNARDERQALIDELTSLAATPGLSDVTITHLRKEAESHAKFDATPEILDKATYRMQMAWFGAPGRIEQLRREVADLEATVERVTADKELADDRDWRTWPGDLDSYRAWKAQA